MKKASVLAAMFAAAGLGGAVAQAGAASPSHAVKQSEETSVGGASSPPAAGTGAIGTHCAQVYWRTGRDGTQRCPTSHSVLADISYFDLHWIKWSAARADGYGVQLAFDDGTFPDGQPASIVQALRIELSRTLRCPDGRRIYTQLNGTVYAGKRLIPLGLQVPLLAPGGRVARRWHQSFPCRPTVRLG